MKMMTRAEAILEARNMLATGEFMRSVTGSTPDDIYWDSVALECGHNTQWCPCDGEGTLPERAPCRQCAMAWVSANSGMVDR